MRFKPVQIFSLCILTLGVFTTGCRDSDKVSVEHREYSEEETEKAVQKAFIEQTDGAVQDVPDGVDRFFTLLGKATRSDGPIDGDQFLSLDGMLSAIASSGSLDSFSTRQKKAFSAGFRSAAGQLGSSLRQAAFDQHKIQLIEKIDDDELIVYTRLYDNEIGVVSQMRWWLLETDEGWRAYDYEDLSVGLRTVSLMATLLKSGLGGTPEPWITDFIPAAQKTQSIELDSPESFEELREPFEKLRQHQLPKDVASYASMIIVSVHQANDRADEALAELKDAEAKGINGPLFHYQMGSVLAVLEEHTEALAQYLKHTDQFGFDSDIYEMIADSQLALEDFEKAHESALAGLTDNPASLGCLITLVAATPVADIVDAAFTEKFAATADSEGSYEAALDFLIDVENPDRALSLFALLKKNHPDSDLIEYYHEELGTEELL
jgi:tetratricopeptide (TPR) repeat protein